MELGLVFRVPGRRGVALIGPTAKLAEEGGFTLVGVADSPFINLDPYTTLTLAALNTSRVAVGVIVTNPYMRHPVATVATISALDAVAGNRAVLGLGTGFGLTAIGVPPVNLQELRDAIHAIRGLFNGEAVVYHGVTIRMPRSERAVPIYLAASGPKTIRLAGELADGVFINAGLLPEVVQDSLRHLQEGAATAGRNWRDIDLWIFAAGSIHHDRQQALAEVKTTAVGLATYALHPPEGKRIPPEHVPAMERLRSAYDIMSHLIPGSPYHPRLADELGISEYLLDRFAIFGTPDDCRRALDGLRKHGVEKVCLTLGGTSDPQNHVRLFAEEVIPTLR